jgi:pimeloyl-ACP methyl ester carboxylesterase
MKNPSKLFKIIVIGPMIALALAGCQTPSGGGSNQFNELNEIINIDINGVKQYISIQSENENNPILLYLHGGPGDAALPLVRKYNKELTKYYTVVIWEQRGAGKSYYVFNPDEKISIDTFVEDAAELSKYLLTRFNQKKIYVIGHSWGSVIGLKLIQKYPELFKQYIGVGQVINMKKSSEIAYIFALEKNIENGNMKIVEKIKKIDYTYSGNDWLDELLFVTGEVVKNKGSLYGETNWNRFILDFLFSKDYSIGDLIKRQKGSLQAIKYFWQELMEIDFEEVKRYRIPIMFIEGKYDKQVSSKIVEEYYDSIETEKRLIIFEKSCHFPQWSENERFNKEIIELLEK